MTDSPSIRRATAADAVLLALLGARAFTTAYAGQMDGGVLAQYVEWAFTPERQADELADPASTFVIAEADGRPIGFARLREGSDTPSAGARRPIELARLYVTEAWIGRGVGAMLMREALGEARRLGCDRMWLGVWEENHRAIAFYRRWGFGQVGRQPFMMGGEVQHDLLMDRPVAEHAGDTMDRDGGREGVQR